VRGTRRVLFLLLAAVIVASVALAIVSDVTRGATHTFTLVPEQPATMADLKSDAAALVRRLQSLGYQDTEAVAQSGSIDLTMYGPATKVQAALQGALAAASLTVRPVECAAPAFSGTGAAGQTSLPGGATTFKCVAPHLLTARALRVDTSTGQPLGNVSPDPGLASVPTTSQIQDEASRTVLLPTGSEAGFDSERLVAGPAEVVNANVVSVGTSRQGSQWLLDVSLTLKGAKNYNALAKRQFHAYLAIDIDGTIVSAPLVEPVSTSFASFGAKIEIEGGFTMSQAIALADDLTSPLAVPLRLE
jgi:preprotein translocase subunit SecD